MDDFDYSVQISERDWDSFFQECEECDLLPPVLAGLDDSGMSDIDEVGDKAQRPNPSSSLLDPDLHIDGPPHCEGSPVDSYLSKYGLCSPENILSGSEEDIDLQTVNLFFERLKSTAESQELPTHSHISNVIDNISEHFEKSSDKQETKERAILPADVLHSSKEAVNGKEIVEQKDSHSEGKSALRNIFEFTDNESEGEINIFSQFKEELMIKEEGWSLEPEKEKTQHGKEGDSYNPEKDTWRRSDTQKSPEVVKTTSPILARRKNMSEPKCEEETDHQPQMGDNSDPKESVVTQSQPSSATPRRKRRKKKRMSVEDEYKDQFQANESDSADESKFQRTEVDRGIHMSGECSTTNITEMGREPRSLSPHCKIGGLHENFSTHPQSVLEKASFPDPLRISAANMSSEPLGSGQSTNIRSVTLKRGKADFPFGTYDLTGKPASAAPFITESNHNFPETGLPTTIKGIEYPALQSGDNQSTPIREDNVGENLQLSSSLPLETSIWVKAPEVVSTSISSCRTGKSVPDHNVINTSEHLFPRTEGGSDSFIPDKGQTIPVKNTTPLSQMDSDALKSQEKATMSHKCTALIQAEPMTCLKEPKVVNLSQNSKQKDSPPSQSQVENGANLPVIQKSECDVFCSQKNSYPPSDSNTEKADACASPISDELKDIKTKETSVCLLPETTKFNTGHISPVRESLLQASSSESLAQETGPYVPENNRHTEACPVQSTEETRQMTQKCPSDAQGGVKDAMDIQLQMAQIYTTSKNTSEVMTMSKTETEVDTGSFPVSVNGAHSNVCEDGGLPSHPQKRDQTNTKSLTDLKSVTATPSSSESDLAIGPLHKGGVSNEILDGKCRNSSVVAVIKKESHSLSGQTTGNQSLEQNASQNHTNTEVTRVIDPHSDVNFTLNKKITTLPSEDTSLQCISHVQNLVLETNVDLQNSTSSLPESMNRAINPESCVVGAVAEPTRPVHAISSFWNEMEKLTINDILRLRLVGHAQHSGVLIQPEDSSVVDSSDATDSGYLTPLDESKPDRSSGDMSLISDFDEDLSQLITHNGSKPGELSPEPINSGDVTWENDPDTVTMGPGLEDAASLSSETSFPNSLYVDDSQQYFRKMYKNISVQNLQALENQPLRQILRNVSLHSIHSETEEENLETFWHLDSSPPGCLSDDEEMESYGISFSEIVDYFFGKDEPERCVSQTDNIAASYIDSSATSLPETYDHFFSEFEAGSFFYPLVEESVSNKDELVPIFSCSRSTNRNLQFPEAYDYFFPDDSPVHSDEDEDRDQTPIRVVTRYNSQAAVTKDAAEGQAIFQQFFSEEGSQGKIFWNNPLSLRRVRRTGFQQPTWGSGSWSLAPLADKSGRLFRTTIQPINAMGPEGKPFPDPLLLSLDSRIFRQLTEQQRRCPEMQTAVADPRVDAPLLPLKQADMALVCIAFASWVLKSANPQGVDTWKAALLANISALSAIRYLRRYMREEAAGKTSQSQIHPA